METLLFEAPKQLLQLSERLQMKLAQRPGADSMSTAATAQLLESIDATACRYEVVIWEVLMPHLIRSAPELASATVTTLQDNHRVERELQDVLKEATTDGSLATHDGHARVRASTDQLVEVLRSSVAIFETEVSTAVDTLPTDQRQALAAVVRHEQARSEGKGDGIEPGVSRAIDQLERDRNSVPIPVAPRSVADGRS
jgi:hypothetical protein